MSWIESYSPPASGTEYPDIFLAEKYSVLWTSLYHSGLLGAVTSCNSAAAAETRKKHFI